MLNMWLPPKCYPGTLGQCPGRAEPHLTSGNQEETAAVRGCINHPWPLAQRATGLRTTRWWSQCCGILRGPPRGTLRSWARPSKQSPGRLFAARLPPLKVLRRTHCQAGRGQRSTRSMLPRNGPSQRARNRDRSSQD